MNIFAKKVTHRLTQEMLLILQYFQRVQFSQAVMLTPSSTSDVGKHKHSNQSEMRYHTDKQWEKKLYLWEIK